MVGVFENQELEGEVDIYDSWSMITLWKKKKNDGKSPFLMGKSTINGHLVGKSTI